VTNPATAPVLFLNVNDPGRIPFQRTVSVLCASGLTCLGNAGAPVPNGHRLVVQHASLSVGTSTSATKVFFTLAKAFSGSLTQFPLAVSPGIGEGVAAIDQPILVYYDQGEQPTFVLFADGAGLFSFSTINLSGYMLDCSIAPCAAIAQ
jgi:hypothetical protein